MEIRYLSQMAKINQIVNVSNMKTLTHLNTVSAFNTFNQFETRHPLVNIVDWSKAIVRRDSTVHLNLYCIALSVLDNHEGQLAFIAPGQVIGIEHNTAEIKGKGHALVFHHDLITGTSLAEKLSAYYFFHKDCHQIIQLSEWETKIVADCFSKIEYELSQSIDKHSKKLLTSNIELFLNYCERFYDRQFITQESLNQGMLKNFNDLLNQYFSSEDLIEVGIPSVAYFAEKLNISANYFGDRIKKEAGKCAQEYIQKKIVAEAINKIHDRSKTINEIAYELGFKYPQHFSRFFKKNVGISPNEFRTAGSDY